MNTLQKLPTTKADIEPFVNKAIEEILSGNVDPLRTEIELKILAEAIDKIRKDIRVKNYVYAEAEKYNKQEFLGCKILLSIRNTPDYSGDNEWMTLKAKLKAREASLKATNGVDMETGEEVVIYKSTEVLTIKL
jgi:chorismate synthase